MNWEQLFTEFMSQVPGGYVILGNIGGGVVIAPFIPKIMAEIKKYKMAKAEEKEAAEEKRKKEEDERLEELLDEREFRKTVREVLENLPAMAEEVNALSKHGDLLVEFERENEELRKNFAVMGEKLEHLSESNDTILSTYNDRAKIAGNIPEMIKKVDQLAEATQHLMELEDTTDAIRKDILDNVEKMGDRIKDMDNTIQRVGKSSEEGDIRLQSAIQHVQTDLTGVTSKVDMMVESDLDDFRNYLIEMHDRHVRHGEPLTKREVEKFCMKYKKYRNEGGNGWGERLYYKILQCKTDDGEIAEEVARRFHVLIDHSLSEKK